MFLTSGSISSSSVRQKPSTHDPQGHHASLPGVLLAPPDCWSEPNYGTALYLVGVTAIMSACTRLT
jgi:hypothetical protein